MLPGPTIIKKCSACSKSIKQGTLRSSNTFGATQWTDGKQHAPMQPDQPWLVLCPHCHAPLWIDELEELGEVSWGEKGGEFAEALAYKRPTLEDYLALLGKSALEPKKIRYLRLKAWWSSNDARRTAKNTIPMSPSEISNLQAFAQLLDESNDNDRLMKAEVFRELGQFEVSLALLDKPVNANLIKVVEQIRGRAKKGDPLVRILNF